MNKGAQAPSLLRSLSLGEMIQEKIHNKYTLGKLIGEGAYGSVRVAHLTSDPSKLFAIKSMKRCKFDIGGLEHDGDDHAGHDHGDNDD